MNCRQQDSLDTAVGLYGTSVSQTLVPDAAFMLGPQRPCVENAVDVVIQLRSDSESLVASSSHSMTSWKFSDAICRAVRERGLSCQIIDWVSPPVCRIDRSRGLHPFLEGSKAQAVNVVSLGRILVTDRLHGALTGYLAGRGLVYIENKTRKISGVLGAAFGASQGDASGRMQTCVGDAGVLEATVQVDDVVEKVMKLSK